jgi:hypothetical protein
MIDETPKDSRPDVSKTPEELLAEFDTAISLRRSHEEPTWRARQSQC